MSYFGDALKFENFALKDLWKGIKKDPKRLVLGVDPWSTKAWNKVLGRDDEPLVDQLGGPYGGHTFSAFGNKDGGVYARAEKAGVPTNAAGSLHDTAHVISALYGAAGIGGAFGGGGGSSSPFGFGDVAKQPNFGGTPGFNPMAGGGMNNSAGGGGLTNLSQISGLQGLGGQQGFGGQQGKSQDEIRREQEERRKRELLAQILRQLSMQS